MQTLCFHDWRAKALMLAAAKIGVAAQKVRHQPGSIYFSQHLHAIGKSKFGDLGENGLRVAPASLVPLSDDVKDDIFTIELSIAIYHVQQKEVAFVRSYAADKE